MEYHYVITVEYRPSRRRAYQATDDGHITAEPLATRRDVLDRAWRDLCKRCGWPPRSGVVLFFSLAPNDL